MRQWIRTHMTFANVVSLLALSVALGGTTYAATGGNFILGQSNSAGSTTALSSGTTGPALRVTNTNTATGATALGLNVASGHVPFTVNSGAKVANLNADKLDGMDSTGFLAASKVRRVGPVTVTLAPGSANGADIATVGHFRFFGACARSSPNDQVQMIIISDVDHSSFASTTQAVAGGDKSAADMNATGGFNVAIANPPAGSGNVNSVSGSAIGPDGQEVFFNLYQGINARNQLGQCMFGGSFVAK
jgi:hypothetical protein